MIAASVSCTQRRQERELLPPLGSGLSQVADPIGEDVDTATATGPIAVGWGHNGRELGRVDLDDRAV